ncbi:MAG: molybdate ABC transporter permease subunit [bacterium]|nr:molybdate ABC transporter permease subunit [bacterium]
MAAFVFAFTFSSGEWSAIQLSFDVTLRSLALIAVPGIFFGWLLARFEFPGRTIVSALLHIPLVLPPVVPGYLLLIVFAPNAAGGWLQDLGVPLAFHRNGAALAAAIMGFPLLLRASRIAFETADPRYYEAARTLGASNWRAFRTITLPAAAPGIFSGLVLAGGRSFGEFGATMTFAANIPGETRTLPLAIFSSLQLPGGEFAAWRLVGIALIISVGALIVAEVLARKMRRDASLPKKQDGRGV